MSKVDLTLDQMISESINEINGGNNSSRNNDIAKRYFGFDGKGGSSMQVAGEKYGLTRESVRQITNKIAQNLRDTFVVPKILYKVVTIIDDNAPASTTDIERILVNKGILSEGYMLEGILSIINIMGLKELFVKSGNAIKHHSSRFIVGKKHLKLPQEIESIAITLISHNGATSINEIADEVKGLNDDAKMLLIKSVVESIEESVWLDEDKTWFFFNGRGRNRFFRRLEQIFSVYSCVTVTNIQKAIERSWKKNFDTKKTRLLNKDIILLLINASDDYSANGEDVVCLKPLRSEDHVKDFDMIIFNKIRLTKNQEIREKELEDSVVSNPGEKWGFSVALNYSPLIIQPEFEGKKKRGIYKLLGKTKS